MTSSSPGLDVVATTGKQILSYQDLESLGIATKHTIWRWIRAGKFPRPMDLPGHPKWCARDIEHWLNSKRDKGAA